MAAASSADADPARRVQIVVTPGSGEGRARSTARRLAKRLRRQGTEADVRSFEDLAALVHWARTCDRDFGWLVCVGGDATLSAAAAAAIRLGVPFVPVPNGFGNVFARVFGHSHRDDDVVRLLGDGELRRVDVGVVRTDAAEEVFLSHRSYGFLEHIQHVAERGRQQPRNRLLRYLWYWGVAHQLLFGSRLWEFAVEVDGTLVAEDAVLVTVANVETYRGFLPLTPSASPIDGLFDVFVMPRVSTGRLMRRLVWLMFRLPGRWRGVRLYRGRHVVVTTPRRRDGISVRRRALPLLVPRGAIDALRQRTVSEDAPVERL
jgi:diacylglycerol kinase (ATP)